MIFIGCRSNFKVLKRISVVGRKQSGRSRIGNASIAAPTTKSLSCASFSLDFPCSCWLLSYSSTVACPSASHSSGSPFFGSMQEGSVKRAGTGSFLRAPSDQKSSIQERKVNLYLENPESCPQDGTDSKLARLFFQSILHAGQRWKRGNPGICLEADREELTGCARHKSADGSATLDAQVSGTRRLKPSTMILPQSSMK